MPLSSRRGWYCLLTFLSIIPSLTANNKPLPTDEILSSFRKYSLSIPRASLPLHLLPHPSTRTTTPPTSTNPTLGEDSSSSSSSEVFTRINFGSCNKQFKPNHFWSFIQERQPLLWVWLGDIIYADQPVFLKYRLPGDPLAIATGYTFQLTENRTLIHPTSTTTTTTTKDNNNDDNIDQPRPILYRQFIQRIPVIGVWDDHDFGTNDGDKYVPNEWKIASQQLLLDFLHEPLDSIRRKQQGVYTSYFFTTANNPDSSFPQFLKLGIILLDNRYHRDKYTYTWYGTPTYETNQDILGDEQWLWLEEQLKYCQQNSIDIVILGSGLQIIARGDPWMAEGWSKFPQSQAKLYALLYLYGIQKIIFISGDVHISELNTVTCGSTGSSNRQVLYDLTSSGLTHSWNGPFKRLIVGMSLIGHTRVKTAMAPEWNGWYNGKNFGEIDVYWNSGKEQTDGKVVLRVWGEDKTIIIEHTIPFTDLESGKMSQSSTEQDISSSSRSSYDDNTRKCATASLTTGLTKECQAVLESCTPQLSVQDNIFYYVTHGVLVTTLLIFFGTLLFGIPLTILRYSKSYIPGGIPIGISIMIAVYGGLWAFIESLH